jgi:hypothetical protein
MVPPVDLQQAERSSRNSSRLTPRADELLTHANGRTLKVWGTWFAERDFADLLIIQALEEGLRVRKGLFGESR